MNVPLLRKLKLSRNFFNSTFEKYFDLFVTCKRALSLSSSVSPLLSPLFSLKCLLPGCLVLVLHHFSRCCIHFVHLIYFLYLRVANDCDGFIVRSDSIRRRILRVSREENRNRNKNNSTRVRMYGESLAAVKKKDEREDGKRPCSGVVYRVGRKILNHRFLFFSTYAVEFVVCLPKTLSRYSTLRFNGIRSFDKIDC